MNEELLNTVFTSQGIVSLTCPTRFESFRKGCTATDTLHQSVSLSTLSAVRAVNAVGAISIAAARGEMQETMSHPQLPAQ